MTLARILEAHVTSGRRPMSRCWQKHVDAGAGYLSKYAFDSAGLSRTVHHAWRVGVHICNTGYPRGKRILKGQGMHAGGCCRIHVRALNA